jgi:hypothetical protein
MKTSLLIFIFVPTLLFAGELAELFKKQGGDRTDEVHYSERYENAFSESHGVSEIGLERTMCFGSCPAYAVIIKSDGTFKYTGFEYIDKKGEYTGTVPQWELRNLIRFIENSSYDSMASSYSIGITCQPTAFTMVKKNGITKVISNYANSGPIKLWAIEQLIDHLLTNAAWDNEK